VLGAIDPPLASDTLAPRWDEWQGAGGPFHTGTDSLQYDGWERVTQALLLKDGAVQRAQGYRFDPAGNLTMDSVLGTPEPWAFGKGQQLVSARGCTFTYDPAGNLSQRTCPGGMITTFYYDALERLTTVILPSSETMTYAYDALGQRIARRFNGVTTRFVWRGGHVLYETTEAGAITRSYTWGIGDDDLIAIHDSTTSRHYYVVQDLLRSVRGLVERTGGTGAWRVAWRYTPYGESFTTDGSVNFPVRFRWAGAMYDEETGLYFLRTRSYDPRLGRFLQEDVAGFAGGGNLYAYADDPTSGRGTWRM